MNIRSTIFVCLLLAAASAVADAPRTGKFVVSFSQSTPLADLHDVASRLGMGDRPAGQSVVPAAESWHVYVPEDYDGSQPYGVLVWISPYESGELPVGWEHALKDHRLIYVAADKSGNAEDVLSRRVPLALTGLAGIQAAYKIDPARLYVGGFSGGGATASHVAAAYADLFVGGLFVSGSHGIGTADMPVPSLERYHAMQVHGRYVFTVGGEETDNQIMTTRAVDAFRALCVLRVKYLHVSNAGHGNLESRVFQQALKYLDEPAEPSASDQSDCGQDLDRRRDAAMMAVRQAIQAGDRDKAGSLLQDMTTEFGALAEPERSQLAACLAGTTSQTCPAAPGG